MDYNDQPYNEPYGTADNRSQPLYKRFGTSEALIREILKKKQSDLNKREYKRNQVLQIKYPVKYNDITSYQLILT